MGKNSNSKNKSSPPTTPSNNNDSVPRLGCIRLTLVVLVFIVTALSLFFGYEMTTLYNQVQSDAHVIQSLQSQINDQANIVNRFNNSVSNADVEKHVLALETNLIQTEKEMKQSLESTTVNIENLLNRTVTKLDDTVKEAQDEIQYEVNIVKADVEQYVRTTQDQFSMENSFMKFQLAGTFCLLAILISMWHMTAHIRQFKRPFVQRKILAILWMSPIYAVTSWLSLVFPNFEGYLAIVKDFYEAYVIYQFLSMCMSVIGRGDRDNVVNALANHADHLDPPMRFCGWCRGKYPYPTPEALASAVLMQCQIFAMQFVFFKPLTAVGLFTCQNYDVCKIPSEYISDKVLYGILPIKYLEDPIVWLRIVQNISVFMAFSGLLKFYHAVQDDLAWCNPFPKFLCIKGIVFMTFWQGLVISFLATTTNEGPAGTKSANDDTDPDLWGKQAQNFLICLEMLLFSIAHFYCFPTDEWQEGYQPVIEKKVRGLDNMAFGDFVADLKLIMRGNIENKKKQMIEKRMSVEQEYDVLTIKDDIEEGICEDIVYDDNGHKDEQGSYDDENDKTMDDVTMDHLLQESVRESLHNSNAQVREAAHRLLRNRIVQVDDLTESERNEGLMSDSAYGAIVAADTNLSEFNSMSPMGGSNENLADDGVAETTSLLGEGSSSMSARNNFG